MVRHHEAADAVVGAGRAHDDGVVRADRGARLRVAVVGIRTRDRTADRDARELLPGRRVERDDRHVERQQEDPVVAVGDAAVGDDAVVLEGREVVGRVVPDHVARHAVDREDLVVARGDVENAVDGDREGLLALLDPGHGLVQVERERPAELRDVSGRDLRQRRIAVLVDRVAEVRPVARAASATCFAEAPPPAISTTTIRSTPTSPASRGRVMRRIAILSSLPTRSMPVAFDKRREDDRAVIRPFRNFFTGGHAPGRRPRPPRAGLVGSMDGCCRPSGRAGATPRAAGRRTRELT